MKKGGTVWPYVELLMVFSIWGSLYVVSKYALGKVPAFTLIFLRSLIAAAALLLYLRLAKLAKPVEKGDWSCFLLAGLVGYGLSIALQTLGTKYADPAMASLLNSLNPLTISLMSTLVLKERMTLKRLAGTAIAAAGVYIILGGAQGRSTRLGIVLSLLSVLIWSFISTMNKKLTTRYHALQITAYGVAISVMFNAVPAAVEQTRYATVLDGGVILSVLYMGVFCTGAAHLLWNDCLSKMDAGVCSAFYPVQPMVSTLMGIVFFREPVTSSFLLGSAVVVCGVLTYVCEPGRRGQASS